MRVIEHTLIPLKESTMPGVDSMDSVYKNLSIMGGFLLLYITGPGKYSVDVLHSAAAP